MLRAALVGLSRRGAPADLFRKPAQVRPCSLRQRRPVFDDFRNRSAGAPRGSWLRSMESRRAPSAGVGPPTASFPRKRESVCSPASAAPPRGPRSRYLCPKPSKTGTFLRSPHGWVHGVFWAEVSGPRPTPPPRSATLSLPFDRRRRLAADVVHDPRDPAQLVDDPARDVVEEVVRQVRPVRRHEVDGL